MHQTAPAIERMVRNKPKLSIHAAVMSCVARCCESETPTVSLDDFLAKLRSMGWNDNDTEQVRTAAMRMLAELRKGRSRDADDAMLPAS